MKKIIINYLNDTISKKDLERLNIWLQIPKNQEEFKNFVRLNHQLNTLNEKIDVQKAFKKVIKQSNYQNKHKSKFFQKASKYAAAAIVASVLATTYFFKDNIFSKSLEETQTIVNTVNIGTDKATLTLEDGATVALEKGKSYSKSNLKSDGEHIVYADGNQSKVVVYNFLTIPRGGQFFVQLSDGTKVWLNSETKLKYPVNFVEGEPRNVELVYGEAYFEVSPSSMHQGSRFNVSSKGQSVEVLGTQFNVKAYQDETSTYTTLVEGRIVLNSNNQKDVLKPKQQAIVTQGIEAISITTVEVYNEISWKDGIFSFKGKSLKELMKVLSRWYDVDVVFETKSLEKMNFKGVLDKNQSIEDIMTSIKSASQINSYEIKNKTIYIK